MEQKLKNILYILVAITLLFTCNYLIVKQIKENLAEDEYIIIDNYAYTNVDIALTKEFGLYNKYELKSDKLNVDSQETYKVSLNSANSIKFQYYNKDERVSGLNLYLNDEKIENEEEFYKDDKFKLYFHLFDDMLVIEHQKSNNRLSFIKIINLTTGEIRNIPNNMDFYVNNVEVSEEGLKISYIRQTTSMFYYLNTKDTGIAFTVDGKEIVIDPCNKKTWSKELYNLDYVAFTMEYLFEDNTLQLDNQIIDNLVTFDNYMKIYSKDIKTKCTNN